MRPLPILAAGLARCPSTREVHCAKADGCARALVPHAKDRPVEDYSRGARPCTYFVALTPAGQATAGPHVHDAPGFPL